MDSGSEPLQKRIAVVYGSANKLRIAQVLKLFRSPNAKKVTKKQPRGAIKSNSVYVFEVDSTTTSKYWQYDGHRWDNRGTMTYPKDNPSYRRQDYQLLRDRTRLNFHKIVYTPIGFQLPLPANLRNQYVVVHYKGSFHLSEDTHSVHGNRKVSPKKRAAKVMREMKGLASPNKTPIRYTGRNYETPTKNVAKKRTCHVDQGKWKLNLLDDLSHGKSTDPLDYFIYPSRAVTHDNATVTDASKIVIPEPGQNKKYSSEAPCSLSPSVPLDDTPATVNGSFQTKQVTSATELNPLDTTSNSETVKQMAPERDHVFLRVCVSAPESSQSLKRNRPEVDKDSISTNICLEISDIDLPAGPAHFRTRPEVTQKIAEMAAKQVKAGKIYRDVTLQSYLEHGEDEPELLPRNRKQVYNIKQKLRQEKHDSLYEVYLFAVQYPGLILKVDLFPYVTIIQVHPELSAHVRSLSQTFRPVVFHYDTTFNVGKFFTSILTIRHPVFENEPCIPVAIMLHETTAETLHSLFFENVTNLLGLNSASVVIVTDRERSIRNAISRHLSNASHIFCWNHIRRNVEEWKKRHTNETEGHFQKEVMDLLQSSSLEEYTAQHDLFRQTWSESFKTYYAKFLDNDIKQCCRFVLEKLRVYNQLSGITNNAAENSNAAIKSMLDGEKMEFFQMVYKWYYYQVGLLIDIRRGIMGEQGQFTLNYNVLPKKVYVPDNVCDVVDPKVIPYLIKGILPPDMDTSQEYTIPSLPETTTMRGRAKLIIAKKKIDWLPHREIYVVTGLLNHSYLVNLKDKSCTCLRPTVCEHRLAVYITNGISDLTPYKKRCQPNIGNLYKKVVKKAIGTKSGQRSRKKVTLKRLRPLLIGNGKPAEAKCHLESHVASPGPEVLPEEILPVNSLNTTKDAFITELKTDGSQKEISLNDQKRMLPILKKENCNMVILQLPIGGVTLGELKTAESTLIKAEKRLMAKLFGIPSVEGSENWFVDSVISGFLMRLCRWGEANVFVTPSESSVLFNGLDSKGLFATSLGSKEDVHNWNIVQRVLIPYNKDSNHWILFVALPHTQEIEVYDPVETFQLTASQAKIISKLLAKNVGVNANKTWKIKYPECARSCGSAAMQCGPFVCFYAEAIVKDCAVSPMSDITAYRNHIINSIFGSCQLSNGVKRNVCCICYKPLPSCSKVINCNFCKSKMHESCSSTFDFRKRSYVVC